MPPPGASEPLVPVVNGAFADEIEAINSIYGASTLSLTTSTSSPTADGHGQGHDSNDHHAAILRLPSQPCFSFLLTFAPDYPNSSPPRIDGTESSSRKGAGTAAAQALRDVVARVWVPGQVCLFDVIEEAGSSLPLLPGRNHVAQTEEGIDDEQEVSAPEQQRQQPSSPVVHLTETEESAAAEDGEQLSSTRATNHLSPSPNPVSPAPPPPPHWTVSDPVTEKKSVFVARCASVHSASATSLAIAHLLATDKKVAGATHNITAWRIRSETTPAVVHQDYDDDGETAAGARLLRLMQLMDVWDVVVVVSRWYGGVKLGPDRFRVINGVAREALVRGGFVGGKRSVGKEGEEKSGKGKRGKGK